MNPETAHLYSSCLPICRSASCAERVKLSPAGRFFITMGHAGFNLPANNRNGYATREAAQLASLRLDPPTTETIYRHPAGLVWMGA